MSLRFRVSHGVVLALCCLGLEAIGSGQTPSTLGLFTSPNPANLGEAVTLTATVTPGATGNVTFYDGTTILGIRSISGTQATLTTVLLPSGSRSLRAYYAGDGSYAPSSSPIVPHAVNAGVSLGFKSPALFTAGASPLATLVADFNGDLKQDVAVITDNGSAVQILLGNGNGTLQTPLLYSGLFMSSLAAADFDGDGKTDLAIGISAGNALKIALGNGDGTFRTSTSVTAVTAPAQVAVGDFNGDGKADLVVGGQSFTTAILLGNGNGTFQPAVTYNTFSPNSFAVGDFNNDGKTDLALTSANGSSFAILKGNGDGTFQAPQLFNVVGISASFVAAGDLNGDGNLDVALLGGNSGSLTVRLGKGDGTFQVGTGYAAYNFGRSIAIEDFNGDGKLDIVAASFSTSFSFPPAVYTYFGNGDGTVQPLVLAGEQEYVSSVAVGEFNGDGKADLVETGYYGSGVSVLLGGAIKDLTIAIAHGTGFTQGQSGASYKLTLSSVGGLAASGAVGVFATLPQGVTATSIAGDGWTCLLATLTCSRLDPLANRASYPQITITVNVAGNLTGNVTAFATVSGGGDENNTNNVASETVFVRFATTITLTTFPNPSVLGQSVSFTATLSAGTGSVTFFDEAAVLGVSNIAGNQSVLSTSQLAPGSHSLIAHYPGDATYGPSTSSIRLQTVNVVAANGLGPSGTYPGGAFIAKADLNQDGKIDIITNRGRILMGNGNGTFQPNEGYVMPDSSSQFIVTGDFNGDGRIDLIFLSGKVYTLLGNGDGTFQSAQIGASVVLSDAKATDLDGDGRLDLIGNIGNNSLGALLGVGDGTFRAPTTIGTSDFYTGSWAVADFNRDGRPDVVNTTNGLGPDVVVRLGNGDGTFQPAVNYPTALAIYPQSISTGDFNADGKVDVLITFWVGGAVLFGNGDGTLQPPAQTLLTSFLSPPGNVTIPGDFNGDGRQDFAYVGYASGDKVQIVFGNGNGTFQTVSPFVSTDGNSGNMISADFNGDGRVDLAVGNPNSVNIFLGGQFSGLTITLSHKGRLTAGQTKIYQIAVANPAFVAAAGTVTVTDILPPGLTATEITGSGWNCTLVTVACTRSDALASGSSYPPISVAVLAAANLPASTLINSASVNWNGVVNFASDPTAVVLATVTTLAILPSPVTLGQAVTMTATVSTGTGTVTFLDGGTVVGIAALSGNQASITTYLLRAGLRQISATYSGDSTHGPSTSPIIPLNINTGQASGLVPGPSVATGSGPRKVVMGDFNGDTKPDLVTPNGTANTISVLFGNGDGTFQSKVDYAVGTSPADVVVGDFNGDRKPDLAVANQDSSSISILLNTGTGAFVPGTSIPTLGPPGSMVAGDFDNDGKADLVVTLSGRPSIVLLGKGDGTFAVPSNLSDGCCDYPYVAGDFNRDRIADLVAGAVLLGNGDGSFRQSAYLGFSSQYSVVADVNGDGKADVIGSIGVALGNGDGTFQPYVSFSGGSGAYGVEVADVNGDGKLDVIGVEGDNGTVRVRFGAGNGTFPSSITYAVGTSARSVVAGDLNGDGRTDLAISNMQSNNITILLGVLPPVLSVTSTHTGNFFRGQTGATYSLSVRNGGPGVPSGTVTVTDSLPAGLTATGISGTGWICVLASLTCTRSDSLAVAASYPPITVTVNVASNALVLVTNQVSASGGDSPTANGSDPTTILVEPPLVIQNNTSLTGSYYFRQVLLVTNGVDVIETRSGAGTMVFSGTGTFTFTGQQLVDAAPVSAISGAGTYSVKSTGVVTFTNPLRTSATVNGRLGVGALVGSSTEAGATVFDLFIAIPASSTPLSNAALTGAYRISTLEFPGGGLLNIRNTNSRLTANGTGAFAETSITGRARNLGNQLLTQAPGPITYSVSPDATGLLNFPAGNSTTQLAEGAKNIFVSADGTYFMGGSLATGRHGLVVGVKSVASGATHDTWSGFFHTGGLSFDTNGSRLAGASGSVNVVTQGAVWARRMRQSDGLLDASQLLTYSLDTDGSGLFVSMPGQVSLASTGGIFSTTGVAADATVYELSFGVRMPPVSSPGVFINPQLVLNAANYGLGYPLSPGGFFVILGMGLANQTAVSEIPFATTLGGVSVTLNGLPVRLYYVSPGYISGVVPFAATGRTATVVVTSNGVVSNAVEVPLAPTAPGIFTLPQNGLGDGATLHANYTLVNAANPARAGEIVQVFLAGMGAVSPGVPDGAAAPAAEPFARVVSTVLVTVDGLPCVVFYNGLAPTLAGLYQLNIQLPPGLLPGTHRLAIQTPEASTDMATIEVGP